MIPSDKLLAFFRSEFLAEEDTGFARLKRVPDSRVEESLAWYQSLLRTVIQQYKMDQKRGVASCISEKDFQVAASMRDIKAPELRKRLRAMLDKFGYQQTNTYGGHRCVWDGVEFEFNADFGSRN